MVVGGSGAVGALLVERLAAAGVPALYVVDRRSPGELPHVDVDAGRHLQSERPDAAADRVGRPRDPRHSGSKWPLQASAPLLPRMRRGSLLVDTLSVKSRFAQALEGVATQAELLGINPMFAPSLGFAGRSVVAVPYAARDRADAFLGLHSLARVRRRATQRRGA